MVVGCSCLLTLCGGSQILDLNSGALRVHAGDAVDGRLDPSLTLPNTHALNDALRKHKVGVLTGARLARQRRQQYAELPRPSLCNPVLVQTRLTSSCNSSAQGEAAQRSVTQQNKL